MLPEGLIKIFDEHDCDDLSLYVTKVDYSTEVLAVDFGIKTQGEIGLNEFDMKWVLRATGHKVNRISFDYAANIDIKEAHPLLWKYNDTQCELYFNGVCPDPAKLFVSMYHVHYGLFRNYYPFETFLNPNDFYRLLQGKNGLFAKGLKKLLVKYAECLKNHGLDCSIVGERAPSYWDGESFIQENPGLKVLFMSETDTYIIAEDFLFSRQDERG